MSHSPPIRRKLTNDIIRTTYQAPTSDKFLSATPDVGVWLHLNMLLRVNIPMLRIFFKVACLIFMTSHTRDIRFFKVAQPVVFQVYNYIITIDTTK